MEEDSDRNIARTSESPKTPVVYNQIFVAQSTIENVILTERDSQSKNNQPESISRIRQPICNMTESDTFGSIYANVKKKKIVILHCWGVGGSGKSQIVRKLAELFPFPENSTNKFVKWHILCKDSGHIVLHKLQRLAGELCQNGHIKKVKYESTVSDLASGSTEGLVKILLGCIFPVVILFEDPVASNCINLLQDFFRSLETWSKKLKESHAKVHIYFTSRKRSLIFSQEEIRKMTCYLQKMITGFTKLESINYLSEGLEMQEQEYKAAEKIFNLFSGLPLGLQSARAYCRNVCSYNDYLSLFKDTERKIFREEKDAVESYCEEYEEQVFQAIIIPFNPTNNPDQSTLLSWKILSCISYFNYEYIPRCAIELCCDVLREGGFEKNSKMVNKKLVGDLINKLLEYGMCAEPVVREGNLVQKISFHEVIPNSFRLNSFVLQSFNPLKKAVDVMSGLITKDFRYNPRFQKMFSIRRHSQTLLSFLEAEQNYFDCEDQVMQRALVSHLYDVTAAIMMFESPDRFFEQSNTYFSLALHLLWKDLDVLKYIDTDEDLKQVAEFIFTRSKEKSKTLPIDFTLQYASKLNLCFTKETVQFLKSVSRSKDVFQNIESALNQSRSRLELIQQLQKCELFLTDHVYRTIFYAERCVSILSNWTRLIICAKREDTQQIRRHKRMLELSQHIAAKFRESFAISLLSEHFVQQTGNIEILLMKREIFDLQQVIKLCEEKLSVNSDPVPLYENGLLKEMFGPSYISTQIYFLRYIVRANARLVANDANINVEDADRYCSDLFKLAVKNVAEVSNGINCIIYCAKYYSAKKDYEKSLEHFEKFFEITQSEIKPRFSVQCWSIYNYARTVCCYRSPERCEKAISRCEQILYTNEEMGIDLKQRLTECMKQLTEVEQT